MIRQNSFSLVDIESAVCARYAGLQLKHLQGRSRRRVVAYPRFMAFYLARAHTRLSSPQLGERYHRDHSTILSGARRAAQLIIESPDFAGDLAAVADLLRQRPRQIERLSALVALGIAPRRAPIPAALTATWA